MKDFTGVDIANHPKAIQVQKNAVPVSVHFAARAGAVKTLEGRVGYRAGDAIVTGNTSRDRWPVEREVFLHTYVPVAPTTSGDDGRYVKRPLVIHALRVHEIFRVRMHNGRDELHGKVGDWLVQYAPGRHGIVSADVFENTYSAFP